MLVLAPVSDVHETLVPVTDNSKNQGGTNLVKMGLGVVASGPPVNTTTLQEVLDQSNSSTVVVKMDVEGMECRVLASIPSHPYIPYILMEWMQVCVNYNNNCPNLEALVIRLKEAGYTAWEVVKKVALEQGKPGTWRPTMLDLIWQHKDAPNLFT